MPAVPLSALPTLGRPAVFTLGLALGCATGVDFIATSMLATGAVHIRAGVYATPDDFLWCLAAYAGAAVVANLILRGVADFISYRGATLLGLAIAIAGSVLCALSDNVVQLSLALAVQGLGAGGLFAASRTLIQLLAAPQERAKLLWPFVIGALGLNATAPWTTAILMLDAGWRMIFVLQAVVIACTWLLVACTYPRRVRPPVLPDLDTLAALDWLTVIVLGAGALILIHGLANLRIYTALDTPEVLLWPLTGAVLMVLAFARLRRRPDAWLSPRRLGGRRYQTGVLFYAIYAVFAGLWNYLIPNLLQLGFGFTFESSGRILTLTEAFGVCMAILFVWYGMQLPGTRRYLALGYLMTAAAAWLFSTRIETDLSMARIMPVLLLQAASLPFTLLLVARLSFLETSLEDFPHAYQFKNIVRQLATAAGTGLAAQGLQFGEAVARTQLVDRVDPFRLGGVPSATALATLSQQIDQQATLVATANLLAIVGCGCLLVAVFAGWQRWLR
ncbi:MULTISPECIES: MFS transporter [Cupriavidus]|uniref:MFS transporter n=1 Tax=Cupriavidus pauculus TaxID=82633 RepID=A0A5P2HC04_9BURK|nr:MFS transporter [Cupriavidus pauculus]QET05787.1 MFS transporter [Cupriavidus pauculus]